MNKIKIHNIITVNNGERKVVTHNQMNPFFRLTVTGDIPCAYCKVVYDGGFVVLKTTVSAYDFNGESEEKFCEYKVVITNEDMPSGKIITGVGLTPTTTAENLVNFATVDPIDKLDGQDLEITVKLILTATMSNCTFTSGYNVLVAILLGNDTFYQTSTEIAIGRNDHPLVPIERDSGQLQLTRVYSGISVTENEIEFSLTSPVQGDEMVVFINGKSVLRGCYYGNTQPVNIHHAVDDNKTVTLNDRYLTGVASVTRSSGNRASFSMRRLFGGATTDCEKIIDFTIPSGSVLVADPSRYYFAVADDKQVRVYKMLNREITHCYSVERDQGEMVVASDGSLFFAGNQIIAHYYDGATTNRVIVRNEPGTQLCVICGSTQRICYLNTNNVYVCLYRYDGMIVAEDTYNMVYDAVATMLDENNIIVASPYADPVVITANGSDSAFSTKIKGFLENCGYYLSKMNNGWVEMFDVMGEYALSHVYDLTNPVYGESGATYDFINSEIAVIYRGNVMERVIFNNLGTLSSTSVQSLNLPRPDQIIAVGNYLLLKYGETVETLYLTRGGWRVKVYSATVGEEVIISGQKFTGAQWQANNEYKLKIKLE